MRHLPLLASLGLTLVACGGEAAPTSAPPPSGPSCAPARIELPTERGYATAAVVERRATEMVRRDLDPAACLVSVVGRPESLLVEASHDGETVRARLDAPSGMTTETLAAHVAAHRLLHALLEAHVESALSNGRGVALGLGDHAAICYRAVSAEPRCIRTPSVATLDSITEPSVGRLVARALTAPDQALEWEWLLGEAASFTTRRGPLSPGRDLGAPPPDPDRFARVRAASPEASPTTPDDAAIVIARTMPTGATTVRLETRTVGTTRVTVLSRCEGLLAHCVTVVATGQGAGLRVAPSFATDPAQIGAADDASALAAGALRVRLLTSGHHEESASDLFVVPSASALAVESVEVGRETDRGEGEMITEGCYRTLAIEGPQRVRLSDAHGWSGTHSDARHWSVVASRTCAPEAVLCLDAATGFGPCP